ncbi:MAG: 30S ribosomal protein S1 [Elusimicrobia bacterium HGW-Elusimicrobia-2]|nr:MAG: 30S ribosomal protein S1 [Elusimicrobia bacterium HGW-Elusimicrobia-2]
MSEMKNLMDEVVNAIPALERGSIVKGTVLDVSLDIGVLMDIGAKVEGVLPHSEIPAIGGVSVGQDIEVYICDMSGTDGHPTLSWAKAQKYKEVHELEKAFEAGDVLEALITEKIKGGVKATVKGITAFMPNSQIGYPPVKNIADTIGKTVPVKIKKFNQKKNDIVISWRDVVEEDYKKNQDKFWDDVREGDVREGTVKGITKFGAFVDIGGFEGLLHIKDISWGRTENVADELQIGQKINVKVTKLNKTKNRVSLSLKDTTPHPWDNISEKYTVGSIHKGIVKGILEYGAFVELAPGLEGLLHVSEISWARNSKPADLLTPGQEVEVMVLSIDREAKRISLSLKNTQENPWVAYTQKHSAGEVIDCAVTHIVKNGMTVSVGDGLEGFILLKDFSWKERVASAADMFSEGSELKAKILEIIPDEQKIYLGIKQLEDNPFKGYSSGSAVTGTVTGTTKDRILVDLKDGVQGFVHISQVAHEKTENLDGFTPGMEVTGVIVKVNENSSQVEISIKELEKKKEHETMRQYYSTESTGFSIGDILKKE